MNQRRIIHPIRFSYHPPEIDSILTVAFSTSITQDWDRSFFHQYHKILLVSDRHLPDKPRDQITDHLSLPQTQLKHCRIIPTRKDVDKLMQILDAAVSEHPDLFIALGGGTICDLTGLAASLYHRGTDHVFIPTTTLSMLDAVIGGKTAIDHNQVKNVIGTVHYAKKVYCYLNLLQSLPKAEFNSGFAEAIKAAMLFNPTLFMRLLHSDTQIPTTKLLPLLALSAKQKAAVCQLPYQWRSQLLYGHNIGQAIEVYDPKYHRRHGDCVAIGMNLEAAIAVIIGLLSERDWLAQRGVIRTFGLPDTMPQDIDISILIDRMKLYKLYKNGMFLFVLPNRIGRIAKNGDDFYTYIPETDMEQLLKRAVGLTQA